ncbi:preprotein translocase subunit SecA [Staphylococcus aureus]
MQRNDKSDLIYISQKGKFDAIIEDVVEKHKAGNPCYAVLLQLNL